MRTSILAIASVLGLILASCDRAADTPPADPPAGRNPRHRRRHPWRPHQAPRPLGLTPAGGARRSVRRVTSLAGWRRSSSATGSGCMPRSTTAIHGSRSRTRSETRRAGAERRPTGTQVTLRFERVECLDNMSGEKFEAKAVLQPPARSTRGAAGSDRTDPAMNRTRCLSCEIR